MLKGLGCMIWGLMIPAMGIAADLVRLNTNGCLPDDQSPLFSADNSIFQVEGKNNKGQTS